MKKLVIFFIAIAGFAATSKAQVSDVATATATIIKPIAIVKTVDMNFGNVAVSGTAGTVILAPNSTRSVGSGGVTLPTVVPGTITAAEFTVSGVATYTYSITLPVWTTVVSYLSNNMDVDTFTSTPTAGNLGAGGSETVKVGATLHVNANQVAGTYVSATPFSVTVNYN
jgi:hypothetical protein